MSKIVLETRMNQNTQLEKFIFNFLPEYDFNCLLEYTCGDCD